MTTETIKTDPWEAYDTQLLLAYWSAIEQVEADYRSTRARIEFTLTQRMKRDGATAIAHETLDVKLQMPSPNYDHGKLRSVAELVPPDEWAKGFTPAHWSEPVWVEDKFNLIKIKPLAKYGDAVAKVISDAAIPGTPRLVIKRKPDSEQSKRQNYQDDMPDDRESYYNDRATRIP